MRSTKFWVILIAVLLAVSLLGTVLVLGGQTDSVTANVYQDGQRIRTIDLSRVKEPYSFTVDGPAGTNTVLEEPGRICVSHADCPDQVCVMQGWISNSVIPIVCLPNRLVIQIEAENQESVIDGVVS